MTIKQRYMAPTYSGGDFDPPGIGFSLGGNTAWKIIKLAGGSGSFLTVPVLTTAQRDALTGVEGMVIFNSTTDQLEEYDGGTWEAVGQVIMTTHEAALDAHQNKTLSVEAHTGADTLTKEESFSIHTNLGAGGNVLLTLPQDAPAGCTFKFIVMAAQQLQITPGAAGAVYISGAKQTDNKYIWADDEGESVELICDGNNDWMALFATGIWGVQA